MGFVDRAAAWSLAFVLAVALVLFPPWASWMDSATMAGWVQAFGSIGAIIGSFGALSFQRALERREAARRAHEQDTRVIEGARRVIYGAVDVCSTLEDLLKEGTPTAPTAQLMLFVTQAQLGGMSQTLKKIDAHLFNNPVLTEAVLTSAACMDHLVSVAEISLKADSLSDDSHAQLQTVCTKVIGWLKARQASLVDECRRRGVLVADE